MSSLPINAARAKGESMKKGKKAEGERKGKRERKKIKEKGERKKIVLIS